MKNEWQYEVRKAVVESRGCGVGHLMRENWGGGGVSKLSRSKRHMFKTNTLANYSHRRVTVAENIPQLLVCYIWTCCLMFG